MPLRGGQLILLHTCEQLLTQAEAPIIYMYNDMASVLAYYHRLQMPLEYFAYSTNHVYLHRPNAFGFWQMRLHLCYETLKRISNFSELALNRNCTFRLCLFSQILICDL